MAEEKKLKKEHFEILLENIDKNVQTIKEGQDVFVKRMDRMDEKIDGLRIEMHDGFKALSGRMDKVEFQVKTLDTSVRLLSNEVKETNKKLDEHIKLPSHV